ncbi:hypothetical protein Y788_18880 [Pantoea dispersa 625]|nr:hypothetical protein Y788_18880 [Pantoea dispersa 625]
MQNMSLLLPERQMTNNPPALPIWFSEQQCGLLTAALTEIERV